MSDPRTANCQQFALNAQGEVVGVELVYVPNPSTLYELVKVELIDEPSAAGNTVAACTVLDKDGLVTGEKVYLAWPFPTLEHFQLPGNPDNVHMIVNGYDAAAGALGPLALCVGDAQIISDVIGGLGLPNNRHVSYRATWKERTANNGNGDAGDDGGGTADENVLTRLDTIITTLSALARHLGALE